MAWATAQDVLDDWIGSDQPVNDATLARWVGRAERLLRHEFPTLQTRLDSGNEPDLLDSIRDVISAMVTRVFRNPEGIRSQSSGAGSYTESVTFGGAQPGGLFITDRERALLMPPGEGRPGAAYTVPSQLGGSGHLLWCDHTWATDRCSCGLDIAPSPIFEGAGS